jgi:predicted nucleotidyltransferase component of viral defense system
VNYRPIHGWVVHLHKEGSCQGEIYYRGPIVPTSTRQLPKIKIDLTVNEVIITPPILTTVKHPYSDHAKKKMCILCYSFVEVFAEKIRALV